MSKDLLDLPLAIQISLGSGYLAYLIAYAGLRQHHNATDALFRTLAFGLSASLILYLGSGTVWPLLLAAPAPIVAAVLWRWKVRRMFKAALRLPNISWTDDTPSAWLTVIGEHTDARPSQIAVDMKNGRTLLCENTRLFANSPHGPAIFGLDGSVAFYVTDERRSDGKWLKRAEVIHADEGDCLTYIPADQIERIELRLWTRANAPAAAAVVKAQVMPDGAAAAAGAPNPEYK